jgi:cytochrome c oxidase accessory protein FixG
VIPPIPSGYNPIPVGNGDRLGEAQGTIGADGKRIWLYPKEVRGWFTTRRQYLAWFLMVVYLGIPWLRWGGLPLLILDWPGRKLVVLGYNYWAKDIPILLPLFFSFILLVFLATARYGRIWCGWACPQTIFLQFVFAPVERIFEGRAIKRKKRDLRPWTKDWLFRKMGKHFVFVIISWWIGNTALAYFWGTDNLLHAMSYPSAENGSSLVLVLVFAALFYGNFAFFREQACIMVCPYARFQSVIPDENTSLIAYDHLRGEKRGKGLRGSREGLGDCTDCRQCVLVCPTGIDIRQGQQLECIGCTRCMDACDKTMVAWKKPTGLIRYVSLRELQGKFRKGKPWRLMAYGGLALIMATISAILLFRRPLIAIDPVRQGHSPYTHIGQDSVLNSFTLHLRNNGSVSRVLRMNWVKSSSGISSWEGQVFALSAGQSLSIPLEIRTSISDFTRGRKEVEMYLVDNSIRVPFNLELAGPWGLEKNKSL